MVSILDGSSEPDVRGRSGTGPAPVKVSAVDVNKCLERVKLNFSHHMCTSCSELSSFISTLGLGKTSSKVSNLLIKKVFLLRNYF